MQTIVPPRNRYLLAAGAAFWAGCLLGSVVLEGLWPLWVLGAGVGLCLLLAIGKRKLTIGIAVCFGALGLLRVLPALHPMVPPPAAYEQVTGTVAGEGTRYAGNRLTFTLTHVALNGQPVEGKAYCTYYVNSDQPLEVFDGAQLSASGRVYPLEGKTGEPHADFRNQQLQKGMTFGIYLSGEPELLNSPEDAPIVDWAFRLRKTFRIALTRTMGDGADLAMALLFSEKDGLAKEQQETFRQLGIAHVMAVSGLHVGLLGTTLYWLLERMRIMRGRWLVLAAILIVYCALTGFSAAAVRAMVMLLLSYAAIALKRPQDPINNLGVAVLVVLLIRPLQAFSAGLVLSVSAVLGIYLVLPVIRAKVLRRLPRPERRLVTGNTFSKRNLRRLLMKASNATIRAFAFSLSAQIGVLLPTAYYFHQLPVYGVLMNVVLIPVVSLLVPLDLLALAVSPVPLLGTAVGWAAAQAGNGVLWVVQLLSRLPMASVAVSHFDVLWLVPAFVALVAASYAVRVGAWQRVAAVVAALAVTWTGLWFLAPPATRYVQLSVGQENAALLFDREHTIAIDVGRDGEEVLDYLLDENRHIDALYLTHLHGEHVSGVEYLLDNGIRIGRVYLPIDATQQDPDEASLAVLALLEKTGVPVIEMAAGQEHRYASTTIRAVWPNAETRRTGQEADELPLVLKIDLEGYTIFNASDLSGAYENYAAVPCDVLVVAQHGKETCTGETFLQRTSPSLALISCSPDSSTRDRQAVLERLAQQHIPYMRTDETGDITLYVKEGQLMAVPYRGR